MTRKIIAAILSVLPVALAAQGADFPYSSCTYRVECDCAFIHATAAHATVQYSCYGGAFSASIEGCSVPILGTMYCVNDKLESRFADSDNLSVPPTEYISFINGVYRKPRPDHPEDPSLPSSYRTIWGEGTLSADPTTMEAVNLTADMLVLFYYAKTFDFSRMPVGVPQNIDVVMPDSSNRTLQLTYDGTCGYGGSEAYRLIANFTYEGQLSAYPITVIVDPSAGIPVEFAADIAIGRVVMTYEY